MNIVFKFLFYIIFFVSYCYSETETLEERKERIMRKYFREQAVVYNSDLVIEEIFDENEIEDARLSLAEDNQFLRHVDKTENALKSSSFINKKMYDQWMRKQILLEADKMDEFISEDKIVIDKENQFFEKERFESDILYNKDLGSKYRESKFNRENYIKNEVIEKEDTDNSFIRGNIKTREDFIKSPTSSRYMNTDEEQLIKKQTIFKSYGVERRDPASRDEKLNNFIDKYTK